MTNTEFRDSTEGFHADKVKIVACEGEKFAWYMKSFPLVFANDNAAKSYMIICLSFNGTIFTFHCSVNFSIEN